MRHINEKIRWDREYTALLGALGEQLKGQRLAVSANGLSGGGETAFFCTLCRDIDTLFSRPVCFLVANEGAARELCDELSADGIDAELFSTRDLGLYNLSASHGREGKRLSILSRLSSGQCRAIVTTPDALLSPTMPQSVLSRYSFTLKNGGEADLDALCADLVKMGYARLDALEGEGQFARRGGILDIWCAGGAAVRAEFFGDEIDRMGVLDIESQRVKENIREITILPCRELICDESAEGRLRAGVESLIKRLEARCEELGLVGKRGKHLKKSLPQSPTAPAPSSEGAKCLPLSGEGDRDSGGRVVTSTEDSGEGLLESLSSLKGELAAIDAALPLNFLDKYYRRIYPEGATLAHYLIALGAVCIVRDLSSCRARLESAEFEFSSEYERLASSGVLDMRHIPQTPDTRILDELLAALQTVYCDSFSSAYKGKSGGLFGFRCRSLSSYGERFELFLDDLGQYKKSKTSVYVSCENRSSAENLVRRLDELGVAALVYDIDASSPDAPIERDGVVRVLPNGPVQGFELFSASFALLSMRLSEARAMRGVRGVKKKPRYSPGQKILSYAELSVGDFVVHEQYGIGCFEGMTSLEQDGAQRDYISIKYAGKDKLFVPADQLEHISKYIGAGADDGAVKLSKMGGTDWVRAKERVRGAVKDIARELVQLYAERQRKPGIAFLPDDEFQSEFEQTFEYDETEGQIEAVRDIKADMEKGAPMDRLLCGDVGYGKTEVALRAAFKAVSSGYQVAILVPTTILALQHFQTVSARMRGFPVRVEMLSRFRTPKQTEAILRRAARGDIDILIGTHRLVSKDISFKNLGLLIVDEEQRFGVSQKEKIKQLYPNIDVLTLSATPIPRTLNMAMSGIRDISVLDEAPGERQVVQTYVLEHDPIILDEAIRRELDRGGQVFYLHNRTDNIERCAARLSERHPSARIAVAHGKTDRETLEDIWRDMVGREIDILVCTTIIETGIDVPNANTLIIEDADRMGLSQLHQLRGRVGRSARRAYAYFTYRPTKELSDIATKRLGAIREYAEFGAGFRIALRDMELRGAGNLLGAEQHGHLDAIGYDLYIRLLNEAVLTERGEELPKSEDCAIDLKCDAYLPESYIPSQGQRMELYKRFATIASREDICDMGDELADRFGEYGRAVDNLMMIAYARSLGRKCGVTRITQKGSELYFTQKQLDIAAWSGIYDSFKGRMRFESGNINAVCVKIARGQTPPECAVEVLEGLKA